MEQRKRRPRLRVRPEICIASGECARRVPEVFRQQETDGSVALRRQPPAELYGRVKAAAHQCPSGAIEVIEDPEERRPAPDG